MKEEAIHRCAREDRRLELEELRIAVGEAKFEEEPGADACAVS